MSKTRIMLTAWLQGAITTFVILSSATHAQPLGIGAMGDSLTDEYDIYTPAIYESEGRNWVELLANSRAMEMDFGPFSAASRGAPRYVGYAHNWARAGATTTTLLSEGQHTGLAQQIVDGNVSLVYLGLGVNDFSPIARGTITVPGMGPFLVNLTNEYAPIYSGQRSDQQVADRVKNLVSNFTAALDAVSSAGARVVVGTAFDAGLVPGMRIAYPDALRRQRITDAVLAANSQITQIALSRGMPVVDYQALVNLYYSPTPILVGGIDVRSLARFYLADGGHPSTLVQGLFANALIAAANGAFGTNFTPLSGLEILKETEISPPDPLGDTFDASALVILPSANKPGDFNSDGTVDAADYVVWRKGLDTMYSQNDYDVWRANFGRAPSAGWSSGNGTVDPLARVLASAQPLPAEVPEPATGVLFVLVAIATTTVLRNRHNSRTSHRSRMGNLWLSMGQLS
jgi:hypothetical protein